MKHLVILAPNWLGDAVMALPAIADVRRAAPGATITVAARPSIAPLFTLVPEVTDTIVLERGASIGDVGSWRAIGRAVSTSQTTTSGSKERPRATAAPFASNTQLRPSNTRSSLAPN